MTFIEHALPDRVRTPASRPSFVAGRRWHSAPGAARRGWRKLAFSVLVTTLAACGGGGDGGSGGGGEVAGGSPAGVQPSSRAYAGKCAPDNTLARDAGGNLAFGYASGSLDEEKTWVRSYMDEAYLWYAEIPTVDRALAAYNVSPAQAALDNWFDALKTPALTRANVPKDRFSFTLPTAQWNALIQTGVVGGYGIEWIIGSTSAPRSARVAYVEPGSPAAAAGVARGDTLLSVVSGGVTIDFVNTVSDTEVQLLNQALNAPPEGMRTTFRLRRNGGLEVDAPLTATQVTSTPVLDSRVLDSNGGKVGYLLFNDFILPGEAQLKAAIEQFRVARVTDLILDLRYNGGGYLFMASQLAYMIAPPSMTFGKTFERSVFSDKRAAASSSPANTMMFLADSTGYPGSGTVGNDPLPNLGLNRVYVLTTRGTCSASESVINGLRGVDVEVIVIGDGTCGKPFGFTAKNNCGLSYFPVEFQGVNQKGFGDYSDGFVPQCAVADDLDSSLGKATEGLLAAALAYRSGESCEAITARVARKSGGDAAPLPFTGSIAKPAARTSKFLMP